MSRQITIATQMTNPLLVEEALKELEVKFSRSKDRFVIDLPNESYGQCGVDTATGQGFYDSDSGSQKTFVQHTLFQMYNKHLVLDTMVTEGHRVGEIFTATDSFVTGLEDIVEQGDIVIYGAASTF